MRRIPKINLRVAIIAALIIGSAIIGLTYKNGQQHGVQFVETIPENSPTMNDYAIQPSINVHLAGAVKHPGIYTLAQSIRIGDLLRLAGGVHNDADVDKVNLVKRLKDGDRVYIPIKKGRVVRQASKETRAPVQFSLAGNTQRTSVNHASEIQLSEVPGISERMAAAIVLYRKEHGQLADLSELRKIKGIGVKTYAKISPYLSL